MGETGWRTRSGCTPAWEGKTVEDGIRDRYSSAIEQEAFARHGTAPGRVREIGALESFIYEFDYGDERRVLRVGHTLRRSRGLVEAEVDWLRHLHEGGASVARALPSPSGSYVEAIDDGCGGAFLATAFALAPGEQPRDAAHMTEIAHRYGRAVGKMHTLAKDYITPEGAATRTRVLDEITRDVHRWIPSDQRECLGRFDALARHLRSLPVSRDAYGIVHGDAHRWNCHVDENDRVTFYDFDDCAYAWFAYDIAVIAYCSVGGADELRAFLTPFLRGYATENSLGVEWLGEMPCFFKLREIHDYAAVHRSFDLDDLDEPYTSFMDGRRGRIEGGVPVVAFDFTSLADALTA
jgi:Ser/Thr protein kinase RdoA (MazF antagonist)